MNQKLKTIGLVLLLLLAILLSSCGADAGSPSDSPEKAPVEEIIEDEPEKEGPVTLSAPDSMPIIFDFDSYDYATLVFDLAKGEYFSVRIDITCADEAFTGTDMVILLIDPGKRIIYDAGRVFDSFEFTLDVPQSGKYYITFDDNYGRRYVHVYSNYTGNIYDATVYN